MNLSSIKNLELREEYNKEMQNFLDTALVTKLHQNLNNEHNKFLIIQLYDLKTKPPKCASFLISRQKHIVVCL